jgi:hypothetical protein
MRMYYPKIYRKESVQDISVPIQHFSFASKAIQIIKRDPHLKMDLKTAGKHPSPVCP